MVVIRQRWGGGGGRGGGGGGGREWLRVVGKDGMGRQVVIREKDAENREGDTI